MSKEEQKEIMYYICNNSLPTRIRNLLQNKNYESLELFYQQYEQACYQYTSQYIFPNQKIAFYPQIAKRISTKNCSCMLSGIPIYKGKDYYTYHPFMENLESGTVYTIRRKLKISEYYISTVPLDLFTYEQWYQQIQDNASIQGINDIDFYTLSTQCGENCLEPYPLGKTRKLKK